jgi:hypothetical protein
MPEQEVLETAGQDELLIRGIDERISLIVVQAIER